MYKGKDDYKLIKQTNKSGGVYYYYYCWDVDGTRLKRTTGCKLQREAVQVIRERIETGHLQYPESFAPKKESAEKERKKKLFPRKLTKSISFAEYSSVFFIYDEDPVIQDRIRRGGTYSKTFCSSNRKSFEKNILPYFAKYKVRSIQPSVINYWLLELPEQGLSNVTCNKMRTLLSHILKQAVFDGILESNPVDRVKPLAEKPKSRDAFTKNEVAELFAVEWDSIVAKIAALTSALTGMRSGEIRALEIDKITPFKIVVDSSFDDHLGSKCTKNGLKREVPIPKTLYDMLVDLHDLTGGGRYIFSLTDGKTPVSKRYLMDHLKVAMKSAGIESTDERILTFHSFRHFFNTSLIVAGVSGEITRAIIGHQEEEMTRHYLHLTADNMDHIRDIQSDICEIV